MSKEGTCECNMGGIILIACLLALVFAVAAWNTRRLMRTYWTRPCTGAAWRRCFPDVPKEEIRAFLDAFVEAFGFHASKRLCFTPDDRVMAVYRALYPRPTRADNMELEYLVMELEERYGMNVLHSWYEDITLGELFAQTRK